METYETRYEELKTQIINKIKKKISFESTSDDKDMNEEVVNDSNSENEFSNEDDKNDSSSEDEEEKDGNEINLNKDIS